MANVKKESGSNLGGMFSGIVIVACIFVGFLFGTSSWVMVQILKVELIQEHH
jgi:hypothetical protein